MLQYQGTGEKDGSHSPFCQGTGCRHLLAEVVLISTGVFSPIRNGTYIFEHDFLRLPMKSKQENLLKLFIKKTIG
jgi:hypothetical protein